jgi:hypothetical protein
MVIVFPTEFMSSYLGASIRVFVKKNISIVTLFGYASAVIGFMNFSLRLLLLVNIHHRCWLSG